MLSLPLPPVLVLTLAPSPLCPTLSTHSRPSSHPPFRASPFAPLNRDTPSRVFRAPFVQHAHHRAHSCAPPPAPSPLSPPIRAPSHLIVPPALGHAPFVQHAHHYARSRALSTRLHPPFPPPLSPSPANTNGNAWMRSRLCLHVSTSGSCHPPAPPSPVPTCSCLLACSSDGTTHVIVCVVPSLLHPGLPVEQPNARPFAAIWVHPLYFTYSI